MLGYKGYVFQLWGKVSGKCAMLNSPHWEQAAEKTNLEPRQNIDICKQHKWDNWFDLSVMLSMFK